MGSLISKLNFNFNILKYCSCHSSCCEENEVVTIDIQNNRKQRDESTEFESCCFHYHKSSKIHEK